MANATCGSSERSAGAYCSSCGAGIMASASTPTSVAVGRNFLRDQRNFSSDQDPTPATLRDSSDCSDSSGTSVTTVTIISGGLFHRLEVHFQRTN